MEHSRETPCYRESADIHRQWADFLAAVARRDAGAIVRSGTLLLEQPGSTMELAEAEYIVTALAAVHLQLGHAERARTLLANIPPGMRTLLYRLPLQQLRALAEHDFEAASRRRVRRVAS